MNYQWQRRSRPSFSWVGLVLLGLLAGLAVALAANTPRLTGRGPAPGAAGVSSLSPITLTFNQPINLASVREHFSLDPALPGEISLLAEGTTVRFTPGGPWPVGGTVRVGLRAGARSSQGLPLLLTAQWQFTVGRPRVAYLSAASGHAEVWAVAVEAAEDIPAGQLTHTEHGILDFAASPNGLQLAVAAVRADGGSDLRLVNLDGSGDELLLACPSETCRAPQWSPDGTRLAFERSGPAQGGATHLWLLTLEGGQAQALAPEDGETLSAHWSPDGARLAYYDKTHQQIVVNVLATGQLIRVDNTSGEMGVWTLDGLALLFPDIVFTAEPTAGPTPAATPASGGEFEPAGYYSHLVRVAVDTLARSELSTELAVEDASPAPGGDWLAFGRKYLDTARWTPGRQLWLMRPNGAEAHALTDAGGFQHSAFTWSPDGQQLVYARFDLTLPGSLPEIWIIRADGTGARLLAEGGSTPVWLP